MLFRGDYLRRISLRKLLVLDTEDKNKENEKHVKMN